MLKHKAMVVLVAVLVGVLTAALGAASAETPTKLRVCVADFRPDKGTSLSDRELDYCKMLQRSVEDELVQWYEVEESTRYGSIAKQLANLDSAQAATALGEKAGVHQVVTGMVTKVGTSVIVQCHFVEVPRAEQQSQEATSNRVLKSVTASYKVAEEDDWVGLMELLKVKVSAAVTGKSTEPAIVKPKPVKPEPVKVKVCAVSEMLPGPNCKNSKSKAFAADQMPGLCDVCKASAPKPEEVYVGVCKVSGLTAGPNCKETVSKSFPENSLPGPCSICMAPPPELSEDDIKVKIAQALRFVDAGRYAEAAKAIDEVLKLRDSNGEAWHIKGVAMFFGDKLADAEKCFLKAIAVGYDRASVRDDLANTYYKLSRVQPRNAKKYLDSALQQAYHSLDLAPSNPWAHNLVGCVTFVAAGKDQAKLKLAVNAFKKAAELLTSDPQLLDNAANALAQTGDLMQAEEYAKAALAAAEKNGEPYPDAYETLSKINAVKGDKDNAKKLHELYRKSGGK